MTLSVRQIHPVFVGEVSGVDLRQPLTPDEITAIDEGMDRYAVLVFHGQNITDEQQLAFTRNFGEIENSYGGTIAQPNKRLNPLMNDVSNLDPDHKPLARDDRRRLFNLGNQLWHSDSSFRAIPAKYSILSGRIVVEKGGNTEFADMRAAYDALDDETKELCENLVCEHSLMYSREHASNAPGVLTIWPSSNSFTGTEKGGFAAVIGCLPSPSRLPLGPCSGR